MSDWKTWAKSCRVQPGLTISLDKDFDPAAKPPEAHR